MVQRLWVCAFAVLLLALPAGAITTTSVNDGLTVADVASILAGPGATLTNIVITGSPLAIGRFEDGSAMGLATGVILSSGNIADAAGPNNAGNKGAALGTAGSASLDSIVAPFKTFDAAVIEFDVVTESPTFAIRYVFASEEYLEFVNSEFNDVFAFLVDGRNIALVPRTNDPVTINTIHPGRNAGLYLDNASGAISTQFDGLTTVLTAVALVEPGVTHHIRIAIADTSDSILDSAVLIAQGGVSGIPVAPLVIPDIDPVAAENLQPTVVPLTVFFATLDSVFETTISGISDDTTATFSPLREENGLLKMDMTLIPGANAPAGFHVLTIRTAAGETESFSTLRVIIDCQPPRILGTGQPKGVTVDQGASARLTVAPEGSGPLSIQWFQGVTGMTRTPIAGATSATFDTPPVNELTPYWARITNPCGTTDSAPAFVSPR
ncbi:MAG TPA: choice-of-anchor L domain-containing protein [Thermoanaerobaculia bacterium]|nr:choice-of-anchor L domain-containing protein [Thermoanaerobaculia bacterium]